MMDERTHHSWSRGVRFAAGAAVGFIFVLSLMVAFSFPLYLWPTWGIPLAGALACGIFSARWGEAFWDILLNGLWWLW